MQITGVTSEVLVAVPSSGTLTFKHFHSNHFFLSSPFFKVCLSLFFSFFIYIFICVLLLHQILQRNQLKITYFFYLRIQGKILNSGFSSLGAENVSLFLLGETTPWYWIFIFFCNCLVLFVPWHSYSVT